MAKARMNAGPHPFTVNPLKSFPASLIIMVVTNNLTKKDNYPSVMMFNGNRYRKPIFALSRPMTSVTKTAVT
jgi:hypothetical protein